MDDSCHAFVSMFDEPSHGALADLRVAVKDNTAVAGRAFSAGLPAFADRVAPADAGAIATIRRAGGHFVGMTRTDSGGFGVMTPEVRNPVFPGCTVGGSSGGAAAAVAAGLADLGVGTDTGGSTRIPAACCGVYGFKPTHGVVPDDGVWPLAPRFDTVGFLAREPDVFARVMALFGVVSAGADLAALRVGYDPGRIAQSDPAVEAALHDAVTRLAAAGVSVTPVALPDRDATVHAHATVTLAQARDVYRGTDAEDESQFTETATRALRAAQGLTEAAIAEAEAQLAAIAIGMDAIFRDVDVVIGPTLPVPPPEAGRYRVTVRGRTMPVFEALTGETSLANVTGSPALSAPLPDHRGVSLHIQARRREDARLLAVAGPLMRLLGAGAR